MIATAPISPTDRLARSLIFPRFFDGGVHTNGQLWVFGARKPDGASHESAILRSLAVNDDDVHAIGCGIASFQNQKLEAAPGSPQRRYYCGFREAVINELPSSGEGYQLKLVVQPENGNDAHVDVALHIDVEGRSAAANLRTEVGLMLAEAFGPPFPWVCECDAEDQQHPFFRLSPGCLVSALPSHIAVASEVGFGEDATMLGPIEKSAG